MSMALTKVKNTRLITQKLHILCTHTLQRYYLCTQKNNERITKGCEEAPDENESKTKKKKGKKIMKRMMKKIEESRKFNKYCMNMLRMYGYGKVNMPA